MRIAGLFVFVALLLAAAPASADVPAGFDMFETDPEQTVFSFQDQATIPANFFDQGSAPFTGDVNFGGLPLERFQGQDVGDADTIVKRPGPATLTAPFPAQTFVDVDLVQLSLQSVQPIQVTVGGASQVWDVEAGVSPTRPSRGALRILQTEEQGGAFDSRLQVYPKFTFTRLSDGATKTLDVGALPDNQRPDQDLILASDNQPWRAGCVPPALAVAGLNDGFCPGLTIPGVKQLNVEQSRLAKHGVVPAQPALEHFKCHAIRRRGGFRQRSVRLSDQFGASTARVLRPATLCAPAKKNTERFRNRRAHLQCYAIKRTGFKARDVAVRNQFGFATLTVRKPSALCLPTAKSPRPGVRPPALTPAQRTDHFACYLVKSRTRFVRRAVTVVDQFGRERVRVLAPTSLCAPTAKNDVRSEHPIRHLVCYATAQTGVFRPRAVRVLDQFGASVVDVRRSARLCVPSVKRAL